MLHCAPPLNETFPKEPKWARPHKYHGEQLAGEPLWRHLTDPYVSSGGVPLHLRLLTQSVTSLVGHGIDR